MGTVHKRAGNHAATAHIKWGVDELELTKRWADMKRVKETTTT